LFNASSHGLTNFSALYPHGEEKKSISKMDATIPNGNDDNNKAWSITSHIHRVMILFHEEEMGGVWENLH